MSWKFCLVVVSAFSCSGICFGEEPTNDRTCGWEAGAHRNAQACAGLSLEHELMAAKQLEPDSAVNLLQSRGVMLTDVEETPEQEAAEDDDDPEQPETTTHPAKPLLPVPPVVWPEVLGLSKDPADQVLGFEDVAEEDEEEQASENDLHYGEAWAEALAESDRSGVLPAGADYGVLLQENTHVFRENTTAVVATVAAAEHGTDSEADSSKAVVEKQIEELQIVMQAARRHQEAAAKANGSDVIDSQNNASSVETHKPHKALTKEGNLMTAVGKMFGVQTWTSFMSHTVSLLQENVSHGDVKAVRESVAEIMRMWKNATAMGTTKEESKQAAFMCALLLLFIFVWVIVHFASLHGGFLSWSGLSTPRTPSTFEANVPVTQCGGVFEPGVFVSGQSR